MPLDFPNSPSTNDTFTSGGITWKYDGAKWRLVTGSITAASASTITGSNAEGSSTSFARADHNHALGTGVVTDSTVAAAEAWNEIGAAGKPAFTNSWVNYGDIYEDAAYYKDHQGRVYLKGLIKSGTRGQAAFTLPAGYRPENAQIFATMSNNQLGRTDVGANGQVIPTTFAAGSNVYVSLDGISFRAA